MRMTFHNKNGSKGLKYLLTLGLLAYLPFCNVAQSIADVKPGVFSAGNLHEKQEKISNYPTGFEQEDAVLLKRYEAKEGPFASFSPQQEAPEFRDRTTKHFRNANGGMTAITGGGPVHYFESGLWHTIATDIAPNISGVNPSYPFYNRWNEFKTYFGGSTQGVKVQLPSGHELNLWKQNGLAWVGENQQVLQSFSSNPVNPVAQGETVNYPLWASGIDAQYEQLTIGIEQNYLIQNPSVMNQMPVAAKYLAFTETIDLPAGWSVKYQKKEHTTIGFTLLNEEGTPEIVYSRPYYEENHNPARTDLFTTPKSLFGEYFIKENGQSITLYMLVSVDWLASPERHYPVTIDPVINCTPNNSTWWTSYSIHSGGSSYSQSSGNMRQGYNDLTFPQDNEYYQSPVKINLASVPDGSCINATTFYLYQSSYTDYSGCNENQFRIGRATTDPVVDAFSTVYTSIDALATEYSRWDVYGTGCGAGCQDYNENANGWKTFPCGATGSSDVAARLTLDWITIAADNLQGYDSHCGGASDDSGWINWDGYSTTNMPYLVVDYTLVPANNACSAATPASGGTTYNAYTNCSTTDGPGGSCISGFANDIWYTYTAPRTGTASFNTCGSSFDNGLVLYTGNCGALTQVACNDDNPSGNNACGGGTQAALDYAVTCNTTYYIRIGGYIGAVGNTVLNIVNPPVYSAPTSASTSPNFICPGTSVTLSCSGGSSFLTAKWYTGSCGGTLVGTGSSISVSPSLTTIYYVRYEDGCGTNTSCAQVTVSMETTPPSITCPSNQTLSLGGSCNVLLPNYTGMATKNDNCTASGLITVTQSPAPNSTLTGTGNTTVTLTASDASGNTATCAFTVSRIDNTAPSITCPSTQTLSILTGCANTLPNYTSLATKSDNCGTPSVTQLPLPGTTVSGAGAMTVTLTATDASNNTATCSFTVNKVDLIFPSLTCPSTQTLVIGSNCAASLPNYTSLASASDNCGIQSVTQAPPAGTIVSGVGQMTVTLTATDVNNNASTCIFTVNKVDNTPPVPSVSSLPPLTGNCGITVTPPVATDNCAGTISATTVNPTTYTTPGNYVINWNYSDGNGNTVSQSQNVTVTAGSVTASVNSPLCTGANLNFQASGSSVGTYAWSGPNTYNSNTQNPVIMGAQPTNSGTYQVTWTSAAYPSCQATQSINAFVGPFGLSVTADPVDSTLAHAVISNCAPNYTLYWRRIVSGSVWSNLTSAGNTPDITGLMPATAYVAYAVDANGATSSFVYFVTSGTPVCGPAPTPLTATVNCDKIFVNWASGYSQYTTYFRKISPTLGATSSAYTTATSRVYTITPANFGSTYEVSVSGMCGNQYSITAPPVYVTVNDPRPAAPTGLTFSATCSTITTNWQAVPNASGYYVKIKNTVSGSTFVNFYTTNLSYTRVGMASNFNYEVWVVPVGCSNLLGTASQHYIVQTCTGTVTPFGTRPQAPDPTEEYANPDEITQETEMISTPSVSVYPNPNNGTFFVELENIYEETASIEVLNLLGQTVFYQEVHAEQGKLKHEVQLRDAETSGTYIVKVTTASQTYLTKVIRF